MTSLHPVQVIISSAFETSIAIAQYACLAHAINQHLADGQSSSDSSDMRAVGRSQNMPVASQLLLGASTHGLATEDWFQQGTCQDLLHPLLNLSPLTLAKGYMKEPRSQQVQAISTQAAEALLRQICFGLETATAAGGTLAAGGHAAAQPGPHRQVHESEFMHDVTTAAGTYSFSVCMAMPGQSPTPIFDSHVGTGGTAGNSNPSGVLQASQAVCIFLHGFLGDKEDWQPIMRALALTHHCIALDLPGHGRTVVTPEGAHASTCCST